MSKFTPGPWEINKNLDITYEDRYIALVCFHLVGDVPNWSIKQQEEAKSNARLIAAAPEMYELLKEELIPTSDYGGIVSFEREKKIKTLLERIDGEVEDE